MFDIDGDGKGDSGYFYLSYESTMGAANALDFMPVGTYNNLYYYDGGVETLEDNIYTYVNNSVTAANIYQVKKPKYNAACNISGAENVTEETTQTLRAVQVGIEQYGSEIPINVKIEIYKGLSPDTSIAYSEKNNPRNGELVTTQTASVQYAGYHTIDLTEPIALNVGDWFSVVVLLATIWVQLQF
jgi:hypothetical protein